MNKFLRNFLPELYWRSIYVRITLITFLSCLVGIGVLAIASVHILKKELEKELGLQQYSTAKLIATQVDNKLKSLVLNLESVSRQLVQVELSNKGELQSILKNNADLPSLFSAGVFVFDTKQQVVGTLFDQNESKEVLNQIARYVPEALREAHSSVTDPFYDEQSGMTMSAIVVPIRHAGGDIIGVLIGLVDLNLSSSFGYFTDIPFGSTGYFVLVAPKSRLVVTATDTRRKGEQLPEVGKNLAMDRFLEGWEGTQKMLNTKGETILSSVKRVDTSGWLVAVSLPVAEAYTTIDNVQRRLVSYFGLIAIAIGIFLAWVIRQQLAPLSIANAAVVAQANNINTNIEIPSASQDEIGQLVTDFNYLLTILRERDTALAWSEKRFRAIFDAEPECVKLVKANGKLLDMNAAGLNMLEVDSVDQVKARGLSSFIIEEYRAKFAALFDDVIRGKSGSLIFEAKGLKGSHRWLESHAIPFQNPEDGENMMLAVTRDITQQRQAQMDLRESEYRWKFAIEGSGDGLWDWNITNNTVYFSRRLKEILGFAEQEIGDGLEEWSSRVHPDDMTVVMQDVNAHLDGATPLYRNIHRLLCKGGEWKWILARGVVVERDDNGKAIRMIGTHSDISEQRATQEALQTSLKEKVGLLNEVHHRVKNNLQVITSLLRLESGRSDNSETKEVLNDMQARIRSMALLHESLYRSGIFASADLGAYLRELATHTFRAQAHNSGLHLHLELESITVSMDQATPCGLMVNELISNCFKHAFSGRSDGEIRITLQRLGVDGQVRLRISDNGLGMPDDLEARCERSLGLRLVTDLASQMQGKLETCFQPNTEFTVVFVPDVPQPLTTINTPDSTVRPREFV